MRRDERDRVGGAGPATPSPTLDAAVVSAAGTGTEQQTSEDAAMTDQERWPQLDQDAPAVPAGMRPKRDVEYGCGASTCHDCYESDE